MATLLFTYKWSVALCMEGLDSCLPQAGFWDPIQALTSASELIGWDKKGACCLWCHRRMLAVVQFAQVENAMLTYNTEGG